MGKLVLFQGVRDSLLSEVRRPVTSDLAVSAGSPHSQGPGLGAADSRGSNRSLLLVREKSCTAGDPGTRSPSETSQPLAKG